jgi:hypothetical protein
MSDPDPDQKNGSGSGPEKNHSGSKTLPSSQVGSGIWIHKLQVRIQMRKTGKASHESESATTLFQNPYRYVIDVMSRYRNQVMIRYRNIKLKYGQV